MYGGNNCTPMRPLYVDENQVQYDSTASTTQLQLFGSVPTRCTSLNRSSKRSRKAEDVPIQPMLQISLNNIYQDENPTAVSTGLKLSYGNNEHDSSVTTASGNVDSLPFISPIGDVRAKFERQKKEFDHYIIIEEKEFAKGVKEMRKRHMASFLNTINKGVCQQIREKELEIDTMNRKNRDLADKIKETAIEAQNWQYRACYNESMVHVLQNNFKQVLAAHDSTSNADQGGEGCGDSEEVDDAASSINKIAVNPQSYRNMNCRICERKEVCMLILPCRHLCMCQECDVRIVDACPICLVAKTASIRVYMS